MIFLPLPFLIAEFFLFIFFAKSFGFFPVLGAYIAPSILGLLILGSQSRSALAGLQAQMQRGRDPGQQVIAAFAKFVSGVLLIVPFFTTRVAGVLLLLPGTRQLLFFMMQSWISKKVAQGKFRVFTAGRGPTGGFYAGPDFGAAGFGRPDFAQPDFLRPDFREERDATIVDVQAIDVTPVEIQAPPKDLEK